MGGVNIKYIRTILTVMVVVSVYFIMPETASGNNMKIEYFRRQSINENIELQQRIAAYDSLINYTDPQKQNGVKLDKGQLLYDYGNYDHSLSLVNEISSSPETTLPERLKSEALKVEILLDMQQYAEAFKTAHTLLTSQKPDSLRYYDVFGQIELTNIFMRLDDVASVRRYLNRAEKQYSELDAQETPPSIYNMLKVRIMSCQALLKLNEDNCEEAFRILNQALEICNHGEQRARIINNIGYLFANQREYDIAGDYFHDAIAESSYAHRPEYIINYIAALSDRQKWDEVLNQTQKYEPELSRLPAGVVKIKHYTALAEAYYNLGRYQEACDVLMKQQQLQSEAFSKEFSDNLARQINQYETHLLSTGYKNARTRSRRTITTLYILSAALTVLLAIFGVLSLILRKRVKKTKSEMAELKIPARQQIEEKEKINESLESQSKKLSTLSLKMAILCDNINNLSEIAANPCCQREKLNDEIENLVKKFQREGNLWKIFECHFEQVNLRFFNNLYRLHPSLTPAEIRMCAFILCGMTVKEIALLTSRSYRTVESIRYSLRKKLEIDTSTETYLRYLSTLNESECERLRQEKIVSA